MTSWEFVLQPFPAGLPLPAITLSGNLRRQGTLLAITYTLAGRLADLIIPPPAPAPTRRWLLWEATCCEFFLAIPGAEDYWEFNLSPSGDWNVFHLSGYRQGIREESAIDHLPLVVQRRPNRLTLSLQTDLAAIFPPDHSWKAAVSAVLQHADGRCTFWALSHPAPQPDFHHRASFLLAV